ncbi:M56 family metallopeptidase [Dokdonella sp.]|uniref:M56 family metallopeptidase n=1 Tax=Dokdonella sp. TaxID=2291710 RepID=UPI001B230DAD|nr:M56 family metallopeptidase [Dokdonella sp.]MBO9664621.1 TonB family protein [Dokdonella sp.]
MTLSQMAQLPWMQALGWTLLHFIWQGALVGVVFAGLRSLIPASHCNARYANGLAALALLLAFPLITLFAMLRPEMQSEAVLPGAAEAMSTVTVAAAATHSTALSMMDIALQWIVCLWVAGVLLMAYRSWYQWRSLVQIARKWSQSNPELEAALLALAGRFEFMRRIKVLVSDHIDTPILIGWFKPVILLPTAVVLGFPRQQIELILAHELGHLRRYDHVVNLVQAMVETLLFYHPVVHWISREVRNEREICCDTLVLHKTSSDPREYARTLAALEELRQPPAQLALAATGGVLLDRVRRILGGQRGTMKRSGRWPWLFAIAGAAIAFLVAMRVEQREPVQVAGFELLLERPVLAELVPTRFAAQPVRPRLLLPVRDSDPPQHHPGEASRIDAPPPAKLEEPRIAATSPQAEAALPTPSQNAVKEDAAIATAPTATMAAAADAPAPTQPDAAPAALAVADVSTQIASAPVAPAPVEKEKKSAPLAIHTVSPEYPESSPSSRAERVKLEFSISSDGSVRDVRVASDQPIAFARAAERALKQWRFQPGTFAQSGKKRYAQTFVFASPRSEGETADAGCERRTGSRLCRRPNESGIDALAPQNDSRTAETEATCDRSLGSRICNGSVKLNIQVMDNLKQVVQSPYSGTTRGG